MSPSRDPYTIYSYFFRNFVSCTSFCLQPQLLKVIASSAESKPGVNYQIIRHLLALHVLSKISSYISAENENFNIIFLSLLFALGSYVRVLPVKFTAAIDLVLHEGYNVNNVNNITLKNIR